MSRPGEDEAVPALRWESHDADGTTVWAGYSGSVWVASAWFDRRSGGWRWKLVDGLHRDEPADGHADIAGDVPTFDAALPAADAAFGAWCERAGLVAAGWRPIAEAPRDGVTWIMAWGGAFPFAATVDSDGTVRDCHGDEVDIYDDEPPVAWWMPMPTGPGAGGAP